MVTTNCTRSAVRRIVASISTALAARICVLRSSPPARSTTVLTRSWSWAAASARSAPADSRPTRRASAARRAARPAPRAARRAPGSAAAGTPPARSRRPHPPGGEQRRDHQPGAEQRHAEQHDRQRPAEQRARLEHQLPSGGASSTDKWKRSDPLRGSWVTGERNCGVLNSCDSSSRPISSEAVAA